ncbi:beta-propeller domain-containing protein, methanol dehydrogenase [Saprospira grandis DSM 2844]|uniref:Beta-propeller domain-containing protein, methanol dehydrogenase n=1 Tax=Saprospira grandis DSM 2844 TaxID=694433 RepID=J0P3K4_9BACT|nr:TPM domain-containing protein [Saprospira grandis]EJF54404.1 beta-propeller domain-containing protein, methanol dehydrogenase [Saprospira grandis DSM 2844]
MRLLLISFILGLSVCLQAQNFPVRPVNYRAVNDFAEMIDAASAAEIEQQLQAFNDTAGVQIALITVQNLDGWSIEQYGQQLAEKWGIGHAETDQGLLLLLAKEERKVRFEVGYGLEERLPDLYCQEVIDQVLTPAFKQGQFGEGCLHGLQMVQLQLQGQGQGPSSEISVTHSLLAQAFIAENKAFDWVLYSFLIVVFLSALYEGGTIRPYPWINFFMALLGAPIYLFMVVGLCFLPIYLIASKSFAYTPTLVWTLFGVYLVLLLFWAIYFRGQFAKMAKDSFKGGGGSGGGGGYSSGGYSSYSGSSSSSYSSSSSSSSSWGGGSFGGGGASGGW